MAGAAGLASTGHRMVEWDRSVISCLERAAHYEQKAERAVDPAARQSFLDAANRWRQSAEIYQSMKWAKADPAKENGDSKELAATSVGALAQAAGFTRNVMGKLRNWPKSLGSIAPLLTKIKTPRY